MVHSNLDISGSDPCAKTSDLLRNTLLSWTDFADACKAIDIRGCGNIIRRKQISYITRDLGQRQSQRTWCIVCGPCCAMRLLLSSNFEYCKPLLELSANAVRTSIKEEGGLSILGCVEYRRTEESAATMPSWVPDWRFVMFVKVDLNF